ncbi:MAG TPA: 1-deoxy-D-xylulose-5-phosphate reductoisomerase [Leptospiraceae bacterium]|nr:1-deoxy-D-xylulose-5-phosphate reductoisomerase [Leptospiraceae bacterium]HMX32364.1 1-deoxy-D-xylulose-5-phosphate reductoisomerase [Leptospiraceae bacterium]HMY32683.1 1-deoxy-D-xylulose-5-phosphate reductoisomerase [Leptospiraceae bacterium]HNA05398.1 1-deoxy-D-xylulose-5-phosphate reductoisomerase [Leptospiraceae bacterium]HNB99444.1 1-deoxy-D-xylulose-5-phosphate reductoisomerase [Leptospiraceae bacterium]
MQRICLLGASGSVGESTLKVIRLFPESFGLYSFSVHSNLEKAKLIIEEFSPSYAVVTSDEVDKTVLGNRYKSTRVLYGASAMSEIVKMTPVHIVVTAVVGSLGVHPTIASIEAKKKIAIANKETLVTFGPYINSLLEKYKVTMVPVDSEHNALFQLVESQKKENIASLTLTASGGSFRDLPLEKLKNVTVEEALNHPTWKMGPKITVDSAGLINKGLEVIEAHFLFGIPYENIEVVIHPESIVHGMLTLIDGATLMYASHPDMIYPIAHSLFYPKMTPKVLIESKPPKWKKLNFWEPNAKRYPALALAYETGKKGGTAPALFNAANEEAVNLFLNKKIQFTQIPEKIDSVLQSIPIEYPEALEPFLEADRKAREWVRENS